MVIGICDDDKQWRESCKRTLEGFSLMIELTIEIKCFATAGELLEYKGTPLDAVFLDIELGRENGIFVAKKLNKTWPSCQVDISKILQRQEQILLQYMQKPAHILTE